MPSRLGETIADLDPPARRAVHDALATLAEDPRAGAAEPIRGAEIRRLFTRPTVATGDRITLLYRVHEAEHQVEIIWVIAGP
ncbi:hypothetical protein GCM10009801_82050 [Streptomyces albiaxialis]|uniref:Uncharacterized protein n=1 Tax=Streptomyces albiaxialis TaxID=329523 RepID=A0ABN2X7V1_9ACTN